MAVRSDLIWTEFSGTWHDDDNSEGTLMYKFGGKYVGQLKKNKRNGNGDYIYPT
jgi:hypothetical protein